MWRGQPVHSQCAERSPGATGSEYMNREAQHRETSIWLNIASSLLSFTSHSPGPVSLHVQADMGHFFFSLLCAFASVMLAFVLQCLCTMCTGCFLSHVSMSF